MVLRESLLRIHEEWWPRFFGIFWTLPAPKKTYRFVDESSDSVEERDQMVGKKVDRRVDDGWSPCGDLNR